MVFRFYFNAVLTGTANFSSKHSLVEKFAVTGPAPGSGAERRNQELDEVSTAFSAAQPPRTPRITGSQAN